MADNYFLGGATKLEVSTYPVVDYGCHAHGNSIVVRLSLSKLLVHAFGLRCMPIIVNRLPWQPWLCTLGSSRFAP